MKRIWIWFKFFCVYFAFKGFTPDFMIKQFEEELRECKTKTTKK